MCKHFKTYRMTAPSAWASYLLNLDASGMTDDERDAADGWIADHRLGSPVSCQDAGFRWSHDAHQFAPAADCQVYTFLGARA